MTTLSRRGVIGVGVGAAVGGILGSKASTFEQRVSMSFRRGP